MTDRYINVVELFRADWKPMDDWERTSFPDVDGEAYITKIDGRYVVLYALPNGAARVETYFIRNKQVQTGQAWTLVEDDMKAEAEHVATQLRKAGLSI